MNEQALLLFFVPLLLIMLTYMAIAVAAWVGAEMEERKWRKQYPDDRKTHVE